MPVVTRSQTKANRLLAQARFEEYSYENLKSEMRNLILNFNGKSASEQSMVLRRAISIMSMIIGPAIVHISRDISVIRLKLLTVLHNRMVFMASHFNTCETNTANIIYDFAAQLVNHMEKHLKNVIIMYGRNNRIAGYVMSKDTYINFEDYLYLDE